MNYKIDTDAKYKALDEEGRRNVLITLDYEYERACRLRPAPLRLVGGCDFPPHVPENKIDPLSVARAG